MPDIAPPRIGLTLDVEGPGGFSRYPWYALRQNYCDAVAACGGLPLPLPHRIEHVEAYLDLLDGLVITGGAFDIDPSMYGDPERHPAVSTKDTRTSMEMALTRAALSRDLPILGVCGGEQLLAVALGAKLIQHIPDSVADALAHEQPNPRHEPGHDVQLLPDTQLAAIVGRAQLAVNSAHHQAVADPVPATVTVSARSQDTVIEAIEAPGFRFCLGVQWHPEFFITEGDGAIMRALVTAASAYRDERGR